VSRLMFGLHTAYIKIKLVCHWSGLLAWLLWSHSPTNLLCNLHVLYSLCWFIYGSVLWIMIEVTWNNSILQQLNF